MKKIIGFFAVVIFLTSCLGGNESITGATPMDYLPSIMMIAGCIAAIVGIVWKLKFNGFKHTPSTIIIFIGGMVALFGLLIYWAG